MDWKLTALRRTATAAAMAAAVAVGFAADAGAQQRELKVGYQKHPIQDASLDMMEKWAKVNNI